MIYFDTTRLLEWQGRYTGMEHVAYMLARALTQQGARLVYFTPGLGFIDVTDDVVWQDRMVKFDNVRQGSLKKFLRTQPQKVLGELRRRSALRRANPVVFTEHDTFFTSDGLWDRQDYIAAVLDVASRHARITHLVHDIVPVVVPHLVHDFMTTAMTEYFTAVTPHIDTLVSISQNTQHDFMKHFGKYFKEGAQQYLFHHGDDVPDAKPLQPDRMKGLDDFILCVGTIEIRKNHHLLYETYRLASEKGVDLPPLVIIGRDGWLSDQTLKLMREDPVVKDKIIFLGAAPDSEMVWCYQNCLFTVMPSYYEGWGLQVAQSLYFGKVAAVSTAGPLPEVGGDLNVYYSPYSADDCLSAITGLLDKGMRSQRESRIASDYKPVTWDIAISQLISLMTSSKR